MIIIIYIVKYQSITINDINIFIANSFRNYYNLPTTPIYCKKKKILYKCIFSYSKHIKYSASIYNGNRKFPIINNNSYNIIMTKEKLSQVKFMRDIGNGRNKYYQLAVDYRLFTNKWHISYPSFSDYNLYEFIHLSKKHFINTSLFLKRKNVVYIQKVSYLNRQNIVKEIMNNIEVDSFGRDLNNKEWPKNISRRNKVDILKKYKFCIAIENSVNIWKNGTKYEATTINNDYVTEKLIDCLLAGSIPIYFGPKNIYKFLPHPTSIINIRDFESIKHLTDYIKTIMNESKLLYNHLKWHNNISKDWFYRFNYTYSFNYCKICNYVKK